MLPLRREGRPQTAGYADSTIVAGTPAISAPAPRVGNAAIVAALIIAFLLPITQFPFFQAPLRWLGLSPVNSWSTGAVIGELCALVFIVGFVVLLEKKPLSSVGLKRPTFSDLWLGLALFAVVECAATLGPHLIYHLIGKPLAVGHRDLVYRVPLSIAMIAAVTNGIVEELIARGFAIEQLKTVTHRTMVAAVVALLADLAIHIPFWGYRYAIAIAPLQLMFVLTYLWRRNLTPCIVAHILNDATPRAAMAGAAAMALTAHLNYYTAEGMVFMNGGYSGAAIASFTDAISHDPKDLHAYELRAWEYGSMGAYDREVADLNHAIALAPSDSRLYGRRALAKDDAADYAGAIADYRKAIQLRPDDPEFENGLVWVLATCPNAHIRDGRRALDLAWKASDRSGWKDSSIIDTLAAANAELGDFAQAQAWERTAINLAGSDSATVHELQARLALYLKHQPYREPIKPA
ncbi:MAG TPA: CPBP family glutamic-type intramembrane protease [Candidatus Binataceae bacterium]|nr:CPBP family glutamic-type intramembrane protease [Candidatus Binataceae bacterium]